MMYSIKAKLQSTSGASMMLALLFLFFCLTVGAVVLTAASASAGRTERNRREQQNYLAVQSAANLLMDDMRDMAFRGTYVYKYYTEYYTVGEGEEAHTESYSWKEAGLDSDHTALDKTKFETFLTDHFVKLFLSTPTLEPYQTTPSPVPDAQKLEFSTTYQTGTSGSGHDVPAVAVDLTVGIPSTLATIDYSDKGYTVTAEIYLADSAPEGDHRMTIVLTPTVSTNVAPSYHPGNPEIDITTITSTVTWSAEITKGAATWES